MNQEGKKADPTRSKWLHRVGITKLAGALVERSQHLQDNVDTVRDRLSQRNPRLCAFNTLSRAFEEHWTDFNQDDEAALQKGVDHLVSFWDKLVGVRPELGKLDITRRKKVRETSLVDSALAIAAYVALARLMRDQNVDLSILDRLSATVMVNGKVIDFLSRQNPLWEEIGVLVPVTKRNGTKALNLRNAKEPRKEMLKRLADLIGVHLKDGVPAQAAVVPSRS